MAWKCKRSNRWKFSPIDKAPPFLVKLINPKIANVEHGGSNPIYEGFWEERQVYFIVHGVWDSWRATDDPREFFKKTDVAVRLLVGCPTCGSRKIESLDTYDCAGCGLEWDKDWYGPVRWRWHG